MTDKFVYFLRPVGSEGPIKIGVSWKPESRLLDMMDWSPVPLEIIVTIPGGADLERNLHDCFFDQWLRHEWFKASPELLALIERLKAGVPVHVAYDLTDKKGDRRAEMYGQRGANRRARRLATAPSKPEAA